MGIEMALLWTFSGKKTTPLWDSEVAQLFDILEAKGARFGDTVQIVPSTSDRGEAPFDTRLREAFADPIVCNTRRSFSASIVQHLPIIVPFSFGEVEGDCSVERYAFLGDAFGLTLPSKHFRKEGMLFRGERVEEFYALGAELFETGIFLAGLFREEDEIVNLSDSDFAAKCYANCAFWPPEILGRFPPEALEEAMEAAHMAKVLRDGSVYWEWFSAERGRNSRHEDAMNEFSKHLSEALSEYLAEQGRR